jgi:hypothetical protein
MKLTTWARLSACLLLLTGCTTPPSLPPPASTTAVVACPTTTTARPTTTVATTTTTTVAPADPRTPVVRSADLIANTHLLHEVGPFPYTKPGWGSYSGPSFSYVDKGPFVVVPGPTDWVTNYGGGLAGMHPWYELTTEEGSPTNLAARVEMSRIGLAVHRRSTNRWDVLYSTGSYIPQAWSWANAAGYLPDVRTAASDRVMGLGLGNFAAPVYEPSLGGNGRLRAHGWSEAGWDNGRNYFRNDPAIARDVDAVTAWVTVRVVGADAARSAYRIMPGFDVMKIGTDVPSPPPGAWSGTQGRARVVRPTWSTFTVSTMSDAMVAALPVPPIPGFVR